MTLVIFTGITLSQVPHLINYQGLLIDSETGQPVPNVTHSIKFSIYDVPTGGSAIWTETHSVKPQNGFYSVQLGLNTPLTLADLSGPEKYLGIKVGEDLEMFPRRRIVSVAYAIISEEADRLDGKEAAEFAMKIELSTSDGNPPNQGSNRVSWDNLNDVPEGFADGIDDTGSGAGGNTLDQAYDQGGAGAGRTITADAGAFEVKGIDGALFTGTLASGAIPAEGTGTRLMWYPRRSALRVGTLVSDNATFWDNDSIGNYSIAMGGDTRAIEDYSTAMGYWSRAGGDYSTAMGNGTTASGQSSTAMGHWTWATGYSSTAMGDRTKASEDYATAMGQETTARGSASTAMGYNTNANGDYSTAMGQVTEANGTHSTAMGLNTRANGTSSTAMGQAAEANGTCSTAMGWQTTASGDYSTSMGRFSTASGDHSTALGRQTTASGNASTSMGEFVNAIGDYSIAMGHWTRASGYYSTAMGNSSIASGNASTAMGFYTRASGACSFAAGDLAKANHNGCFVWGDASGMGLGDSIYSTAENQFIARASGGVKFYSNSAATIGTKLNPGANSWSYISDSTKKKNFRAIHGEEVLQKIRGFNLGTWNYKEQDPATHRHYGPMAQDFFAAFGHDGIGTIGNDTTISSADFDGINFIAIQALEKRTSQLQRENEQLRDKISQLEHQVAALSENWQKLRAKIAMFINHDDKSEFAKNPVVTSID
jgi:hypothetical protein